MSAHRGKFVAYFRVSTDRQGKSGLGLDAQRKAVRDYLNGGTWSLIGEFTEVESGKRNSRPELVKALAACKRNKAKLVIAKEAPRIYCFTRQRHSDVAARGARAAARPQAPHRRAHGSRC